MQNNIKEIKMTDETRLAVLEQIADYNKKHLDGIDKSLNCIAANLESLRRELNDEFKEVRENHSNDNKELIESINSLRVVNGDNFKELRKEMSSQLKWILGIMLTLFSGIYATLIGQVVAKVFNINI